MRLNSTWRPNTPNSPHGKGYAVDLQPVVQTKWWAKHIIELLDWSTNNGFRIFWEWSRIGTFGWIHVDRGYRDRGRNLFYIGYPVWDRKGRKKMKYARYTGKEPWTVAGIDNPLGE
jgi:hypothetical protein